MPTPIKNPVEIAENFRRSTLDAAGRSLAIRRHFPDAICRYRRLARTGPNSSLVALFIWREGDEEPTTELWPLAKLDRLAAVIPWAEVRADMAHRDQTLVNAE
jgi:hypothetical protein